MLFEKTLSSLAKKLDAAGIPYVVVGGQALLHLGAARMTEDIDITLGIDVAQVDRLFGALGELGLSPRVQDARQFVCETMVLPCTHTESSVAVDCILSNTAFEQQAIEQADAIEVDGYPVRFAGLEDLLVQKVIAQRPRDLEDAQTLVMLHHAVIDRQRVRTWLREFEVALGIDLVALFDRLMDAADGR